jgi:hypothetical protein
LVKGAKMKYLLSLILLVVLAAMGSVWAISHFYTVLRVMVPVGMLACFVAGVITGKKLKWA